MKQQSSRNSRNTRVNFLSMWTLASLGLCFIRSEAFLFGRLPQAHQTTAIASSFYRNNNINDSNGNNDAFDFDRLSGLNKRLQVLEEVGPDYLGDFYEPRYRSFSVKPGLAGKVSVTTSCYAILALLAGRSSGVYDSVIQWSGTSSDVGTDDSKISFQNALQAVIGSEWRQDDLFQVSILLYTLLKTSSDQTLLFSTDQSKDAIRECLAIVIGARPKRRLGIQQPLSDYITFHCTNVYTLVQSILVNPHEQKSTLDILTSDTTQLERDISIALDRSAETACNELCRQLAYRTSNDSTNFDSIRLAYSLLSYVKAKKSLVSTTIPIEPSPRPLNIKLVTAGLDAFFEEQNHVDGLWDKGQPIYKSFRRQGRNVGNAFVFVVDTCASLLEEMPAEAFRPHLSKLERTLEWIEGHQCAETIPQDEEDYKVSKTIRGWSSNHLSSEEGPMGWSTAQVLRYISLMRQTIRQISHNDVLREFKGIAHSQKGPKPEGWNMLLDSDLGLSGGSGEY